MDISATSGEDYIALSAEPVIFDADADTAVVTLNITGDLDMEDVEFLQIKLLQSNNFVTGSESISELDKALVSILDDDAIGMCQILFETW